MSVVHLRAPRRPADEGGFTIVEVLVSLTLIAIMMISVAGVFYSGLRTAGETGHRTAAVAVATRELEAIRAVPYAKIGFYGDQPDYRATTPDSKDTVTFALTTPAGVTPLIAPTGTSTVGSLTYSIRRDIAWVDTQGPNNATTPTTFLNAYKRATVEVKWTNTTGTHTATQESIVYPGGQSVYGSGGGAPTTTSTTVVTGTPIAPVVTSTVQTPAPATGSITVSWTQSGGVGGFVVQWSNDSTFATGVASSGMLAGTATSYQITGLSPGTTYSVRIRSYSTTGNASAWSNPTGTATTAASSSTTCAVSSLNVSEVNSPHSPVKTYLSSSGKMTTNLSLVVATAGSCSGGFSVKATLNGSTMATYALTQSGLVYSTVVVATGTSAPVGTYNWDVLRGGTLVSGTTKAFLICGFNSTSGGC